jgi:hypothetical protein
MSKEITTGVVNTDLAELEAYIANLPEPTGRGRLIFGLDATASRQPTWDTAARIQADMFKSVPAGLSIKLIYFRGDNGDRECKASSWIASPEHLGSLMRKITCRVGYTQIGRVLDRAGLDNCPLVFVGDKFEEDADEVCAKARKLREPVFMFQEGDDEQAAEVFKQIADITKGGFAKFETGAAAKLAELLKVVAKYAVGGIEALDAPARLLIGKTKKSK